MIHFEPGLYVRVQQLPQGPHPQPLDCGFSVHVADRALGIHSPSETSARYLLANDRDETWFISNRHLRVVGLLPERRDLRFELAVAPVRSIAASH
jgi:hypothetical protein